MLHVEGVNTEKGQQEEKYYLSCYLSLGHNNYL